MHKTDGIIAPKPEDRKKEEGEIAMQTGIVRKEIRFIGRVQGVGFRYTLTRLADPLNVTGFVSNEYDGSVLSELQGQEEAIELIIHRLREDRYIRIDRMEVKDLPLRSGERRVSVRY